MAPEGLLMFGLVRNRSVFQGEGAQDLVERSEVERQGSAQFSWRRNSAGGRDQLLCVNRQCSAILRASASSEIPLTA